MFKHFRQLKHTAISPHLEWKNEPAKSSEARAKSLMKYFATVYGETSATTMEEYTESGSFDMKICRNMIGQIAKKTIDI